MKKIIAMTLIAGLCGVNAVEAAKIDSCVVSDFENSIVTVEGTIDEGEKIVTVAITPKGTAIESGKYYSNAVSVQNAETKDGRFKASFKFLANEGMYIVKASNSEEKEFEWVNKESVLDFVDDLGNGEVSEDSIYNELLRYGLSVGIDVSFAASEAEQNYLNGNVKDYASRIKENGIEGVKSVVNLTRSELEFMEKLSETVVGSEVNKLIGEYYTSAEIDITEYNKLSENQKMKVCTSFIGTKYVDMDNFRTDIKSRISTTGSQNTSGGGGGTSGGSLMPSGMAPAVSTTTGQYTDTESGRDARLFEIFTDIDSVSWGWNAILYAYDNGIMTGVGENQFRPEGTLTREQFAKIITVAFNKFDENARVDYIDVDALNWAAPYIASAKNAGFMNGVGDAEFGYGKSLTREDISVVIYRAAKTAGIVFDNQKTDFSDYEQISDYAKEAVSYLAGKGVISGMGDGSFSPKGKATRAQAAKIIYEVLGGNV